MDAPWKLQDHAQKLGILPNIPKARSIASECYLLAIPNGSSIDYLLKKVNHSPTFQAMFDTHHAKHGREENGSSPLNSSAPRVRSFSYFRKKMIGAHSRFGHCDTCEPLMETFASSGKSEI